MAAVRIVLLIALCSISAAVSADNLLEQAQWAEHQGDYSAARELYQRYLESDTAAADPDQAPSRASLSLRITILDELIRFGFDAALTPLLAALAHRENAEYDLAIAQLRTLVEQHPDSYLRDDALYLIGYISLMDRFDFASAHESLRKLRVSYPDTRYLDTALYSEAIALEQLGDTLGARALFSRLRKRHSQLSLELLELRVPKSTVLSRYWFDRADRRLGILDARIDDAAVVVQRRLLSSRSRTLRVTVDVDGLSMVLLLTPSRLDNATEFRDGSNRSIDRPRARYYSGVVEGEEDSWVRVSLEGDSIKGVVHSYGTRLELEPDTLIGTIDYYQPQEPVDKAALPPVHDYVMYPPLPREAAPKQDSSVPAPGTSQLPVSRVAQIAVVVDSQYNDYYGGSGLSQAMSVLNVADGIFRQDFGLALEVVSATVFSSREQDPMNMGPVTLEKMLRNFREYRLRTADSTPDVGLMYLFSGNRNTDEAIGLAWIGAACRTDGFDVGVTTPSAYGDLLVTHELGHSMGALHDTDTSCKVTANRLMWPRISALTEQEFSSCSRGALHAGLAGNCYLDSLDVSLQMSLPAESQLQIEVSNADPSRVANDVILTLDGNGIELPALPVGCAEKVNAEIVCRSGTLPPLSSRQWVFELAPLVGNGVTVMAEVKPDQAADVFTTDNSAQLDIRLAEDGTRTVSIASVAAQGDIVSTATTAEPIAAAGGERSGGAALYFCLLALCRPLLRTGKVLFPIARR